MTEREWLASDDLAPLIAYVAPRASERKQRLYLCGGCRHISHLFFDTASEDGINVAERYADGLATDDELHSAAYCAEVPTFGLELSEEWRRALNGRVPSTIHRLVAMGALPGRVLEGGDGLVEKSLANRLRTAAVQAERACTGPPFFDKSFFLQIALLPWPGADLVRCVFGNPFRMVTLDVAHLGSAVADIAAAIYEDRAFDRHPVLADALEEAGCRDTEVLAHLRGPAVHARGCWVVDSILGKDDSHPKR